MIEVTNHELHTNTAHVQAQADKEPVLISGNAKKQILLNYDDYLRLAGKAGVTEEPQHLVKIAHTLGYQNLADMGVDFGDNLDHALDALNSEISTMKVEQKILDGVI